MDEALLCMRIVILTVGPLRELLESAPTSTIKKRDQRVTISNTIKRDCMELLTF